MEGEMIFLHLLACFFGGALLVNSLPHFLSGVMGRAFQSPLGKFHGGNRPGQA